MGDKRALVAAFAMAFLVILSTYAVSKESPSGNFSVEPEYVYFNWTNDTINITSHVNGTNFTVRNSSTSIYPLFFQITQYPQGLYTNLNSTKRSACFTQRGFLVENQSGSYSIYSSIINATDSTLFFLRPHLYCPPGKYQGNFSVYNSTNFYSSEMITINATIVVPISLHNTMNQTTKSAFFKGSITSVQANDGVYHSYYFNTSQITNADSVTIKLNPTSGNIDLFLFDSSGSLLDQSMNTSTNADEIVIELPATSDMWEIRLYGNSSSYNANLYYNTLNFTNSTGTNEIDSIDLGVFDANGTTTGNFTLVNEHSWNISPLTQSMEIYNYRTYSGHNTTNSFSVLVPSFAQKIKAVVEWLPQGGNVSDWDINISDLDSNCVGNSDSRYLTANITGAVRKEYVVHNGPFNTSNDGYWNITVSNASYLPIQNDYNLTVYIWVDASEWLSTNFTDGVTIRGSGIENSSMIVNYTLDLPVDSLLNGTYGGYLQYDNNNGWKAQLPLSFEIRSSTLVMNNALGDTSTYRTKRNIGFNETFSFKIPYNTTGSYDIYYNLTNSSEKLYYTGNSNYSMNFSVSGISSPISPNTNSEMTITVDVSTNETNNYQGIYRGWMFFNTTSANVTRAAHPYQTFNMTLEVNLTDWINVTVTDVSPILVNVTNGTGNISVTFSVQLQNGTVISGSDQVANWDSSSFSTFFIREKNITTYTQTLTGNTTNGSGQYCGMGEDCVLNLTVPEDTVGGFYNTSFVAVWSTGESTLRGTAHMLGNKSLVVEDTGLYLVTNSDRFPDVDEGGDTNIFTLNITNHGPAEAQGILNMSFDCAYASVEAYEMKGGCGAQHTSDGYFDMDISGNGTESCWYSWEFTSVDDISYDERECGFEIISTDNTFNIGDFTGMVLTVENVSGGGNDDDDTSSTTTSYTDDDETADFTFEVSITDSPEVLKAMPGENASAIVSVKNTGEVSSSFKLATSINSGINVSVNPESQSIGIGSTKNYIVDFHVTESATLGNHSGTFKAYVALKTDVYDIESFTFTVLSTPEREREINSSYLNYSAQYSSCIQNFTQIKASGLLSEENVTLAEFLMNQTRDILDDIKSAINSGDYATAESLLSDANSSLVEVKSKLNELSAEKTIAQTRAMGDLWIWVVVGVVIAGIAGLFVYMLLPPQGLKVRTGQKAKTPVQKIMGMFTKKQTLKERIKCLFSRFKRGSKKQQEKVKKTCKKYAEGYEKQKSAGYKFK